MQHLGVTIPSRAQSLMKMLRRVENEKFTFKIDTEIALVDCTSGTLGLTVELASLLASSEDLKSIKTSCGGYLPIITIFKTPQPKRKMRASLPRSGRRPAGFATLYLELQACSTRYKLVTRLLQVRTVNFSRDHARKWQSLWLVGENLDRS